MKQRNTRRGFTLIELLVVVLIIGILVAVALPQYNKAVEKSRLTEALLYINTMEKAIDAYILQAGLVPDEAAYIDTSGLLDIEVPLILALIGLVMDKNVTQKLTLDPTTHINSKLSVGTMVSGIMNVTFLIQKENLYVIC